METSRVCEKVKNWNFINESKPIHLGPLKLRLIRQTAREPSIYVTDFPYEMNLNIKLNSKGSKAVATLEHKSYLLYFFVQTLPLLHTNKLLGNFQALPQFWFLFKLQHKHPKTRYGTHLKKFLLVCILSV